MSRLDRYLAEKRVPIPWRQIAAVAEICEDVVGHRPVPRDRQPAAGVYTGDDLLLRAIKWYDEEYGERQIIDFGPGRTVFWLRGDLWVIRFPLISGPAVFVAGEDPHVMAVVEENAARKPMSRRQAEERHGGLRCFDVLEYVERLPHSLRAKLRAHELQSVLYMFCRYRPALQRLAYAQTYPLINDARAEFAIAVDRLTGPSPHSGLAKWAAQMALEKTFKAFIQEAGGKIRRHHRIRDHARQAEKLDLGHIKARHFDEVECTAAVRYGDPVSRGQGSRAFLMALELAGEIAARIRYRLPGESSRS